jgi:hypothetical protein
MALEAGAAAITITPPVGLELAGYGFGPSVGILDDLQAQALWLDGGAEPVALVASDLIGFGVEIAASIRSRAEAQLGIPAERVLLSGSHTHSGPATAPLRQWGRVDADYVRTLEAQIVGLLAMARRAARPVSVGMGVGLAEGVAENRRAGDDRVDATVPLLRLDTRDGCPIAVLYNFGCHPVSLHSYGNLISPDYPGYARRTVQGVLGKEVVTLFTLGTAGDVNPAGYVAGRTTPQRSWQIGATLGCEVAKVALTCFVQAEVDLAFERLVIDLPVAPLPPAEELASIRDRYTDKAQRLQEADAPWAEVSEAEIHRDWACDALAARAVGEVATARRCELVALRLGEMALVAMPLEVFVETGRAIKETSPAAITLLCSNTNGMLGYLPTRAAYGVRDYTNPQGLAPRVCGLYAFAPEAEPTVRQAAGELLGRLF